MSKKQERKYTTIKEFLGKPLVRKRDRSLRYCVAYRTLNSVTKPYVFSITWIDDLLHKLSQAKYFTVRYKIGLLADQSGHHKSGEDSIYNPSGIVWIYCDAIWCKEYTSCSSMLNASDPKLVDVYFNNVIIFSKSLDEQISHLHTESIGMLWES